MNDIHSISSTSCRVIWVAIGFNLCLDFSFLWDLSSCLITLKCSECFVSSDSRFWDKTLSEFDIFLDSAGDSFPIPSLFCPILSWRKSQSTISVVRISLPPSLLLNGSGGRDTCEELQPIPVRITRWILSPAVEKLRIISCHRGGIMRNIIAYYYLCITIALNVRMRPVMDSE